MLRYHGIWERGGADIMVMKGAQAGALPPEYRNFTLTVTEFEKKRLTGFLGHDSLEGAMPLFGWMDWIWGMDCIMSRITFPMHVQENGRIRKIRERLLNDGAPEYLHKAAAPQGLATFRITMKSRFYATWQGEALCEETGEKYFFLSFLGLLAWMEPLLCRRCGEPSSLAAGPGEAVGEGQELVIHLLSHLYEDNVVNPADTNRSQMVDRREFLSVRSESGKPVRMMCHILFMQNHTWQGILYLKPQAGEYRFRSFLELIMLVDGERRAI